MGAKKKKIEQWTVSIVFIDHILLLFKLPSSSWMNHRILFQNGTFYGGFCFDIYRWNWFNIICQGHTACTECVTKTICELNQQLDWNYVIWFIRVRVSYRIVYVCWIISYFASIFWTPQQRTLCVQTLNIEKNFYVGNFVFIGV